MKIIYDDKTNKTNEIYGIGLGNFDGIHKAHEFLIAELIRECKKRKIKSMIYTFKQHPGTILQGKTIKLISTLESKIKRFENLGVDCLCLAEFNAEYAEIEAEDFVVDILKEKYNMKLVVTGFNYCFGNKGKGDTGLLKNMGEKFDFEVFTVTPVMSEDKIISSSLIREKINLGEMESVHNVLGRYYSIRGKVEYGNKIGSEIGFPTANIIPVENFALPKAGVYYTNTIIEGKTYNSITNIGNKPTVAKNHRTIIETHIFEFSGWLYGKEIEVIFRRRLREEKKYSSIQALKKQIIEDIEAVKKLF